ncbi:MAG: alpha/beta hydrolase [Oscillospiraceae bacterium]|nr:alpha/beta hydrolase [Oscillospiraceae bacterium]
METVSFHALDAVVRGYLQEDYETLTAHKVRPALVICPGGAYRWRSPREKDPPAFAFLSMGYQVFILEYSCGEQAGGFRPLRELAQTVCEIRRRHEQWHINPDKIAVLGFSAGGHLAASLGALWNDAELDLPPQARPDALVLCYPVISVREFSHGESAENVSGGDEAVREKLHLLDRVTPDFPPAFLWHGGEDTSVPPENSLLLAVELRRHQVPFELHLFGSGAHGISTCTQEVETPDEVCRAWLPLCRTWLNRQFQYTP